MYNGFMEIINSINSIVWGMPTVTLLVGTGIFLSLRLKFFQLFKAKLWIKNTIMKMFEVNKKPQNKENSLTPIQTICTALASTIGTGNIAGVAAAISVGGPGAVFWMWVSAFFGMCTSYCENTLGIYFRQKNNSEQWCGGPMIYIREGLKNNKFLSFLSKPLSVLYSIFLLGASFGIGNMVQSNSISESLSSTFSVPAIISGLIVSFITFIIISGGLKRIGNLTERLVPLMALFYISATLYIFISNAENITYVFSSVIENAFSIKSLSGGLTGTVLKKCISTGFKRGVFSNEAGLGASVTVSSCSSLKEPCEQGMWGIFGVFTDTIIICTLTAFALLSSTVEAYNIDYAINNINHSPMYVYITSDETSNKANIHLMDSTENYVLALTQVNGKYETVITEEKTYTNIMKISAILNEQNIPEKVLLEKIEGVSLVSVVFGECFGKLSSAILSASIVMFSFSTIIGWYFYGAKAIEFLSANGKSKIYNAVYTVSAFIGSVTKLDLVWTLSDIFNGLMAFPNLIALITLSPVVKAITENYLEREKDKRINPMTNVYNNPSH